ncbi:MAG: 30S ribosomal protein S12 methylthiotransferase RimO [Bacillota bacterium]
MKIYIETMGCSKNTVDSELMSGLFQQNNHKIILDPIKADIIVINTCSFIKDAKEESIEEIFDLLRLKEEGNCKYFIVTGCLSERYADELFEEIPEVDAFLGTTTFQQIIDVVNKLIETDKRIKKVGDIDIKIDEKIKREVSTPNYYAYVKIAEGCDNNCTYCIIPKLRGKYRSRKIKDIYKEVKGLVDNGTKEIILIAQDTARYGIDLYDEYKLADLLNKLSKINGLKWIRIQYAYPDVIDEKLIKEIKENEKVVNYLDIPIQHANNQILKRMNRRIRKEEIINLVKKLRKEIPDMAIRTTLIVGFPGETEKQFNELYEFVEKMEFDRLGVFDYSDEEDTAAYNFEDKISEDIKKERKKKIMMLQQNISQRLNYDKVDLKLEVLIEERLENGDVYLARTQYDSPEIDGVVYVHTDKNLKIGSFTKVNITDALEYDLIGEC